MRLLLDCEIPLMKALLGIAGRFEPLGNVLVAPMSDCGMGSLRIGAADNNRRLGHSIAEAEFSDRDGTLVSVVLTTDASNQLFELDVWRVDFSPLQRWPHEHEVIAMLPNPSLQVTASGRR